MGNQGWKAGGESGIRTHGTLSGTPDFESGTIGHSDISPPRKLSKTNPLVKANRHGLTNDEAMNFLA